MTKICSKIQKQYNLSNELYSKSAYALNMAWFCSLSLVENLLFLDFLPIKEDLQHRKVPIKTFQSIIGPTHLISLEFSIDGLQLVKESVVLSLFVRLHQEVDRLCRRLLLFDDARRIGRGHLGRRRPGSCIGTEERSRNSLGVEVRVVDGQRHVGLHERDHFARDEKSGFVQKSFPGWIREIPYLKRLRRTVR